MSQIRLLDDATINKIAAGEVVERPVSVIKELVDNALDAGATNVTVEIKDGGISYIRVTDNGKGIPASEVAVAFLRHCTSKITSVEDLANTLTLGFRGEALASIAAVSRVEILTKTEDELTGVRYIIEGGREVALEEVACPTGTTLRIENLFFNVPARKKFLKKPGTEAAAVTDFMQRVALGHPEIGFKYYNGRPEPTLITSGNGDLRACLYAVYGRDILDKMLPLEYEEDGLRLVGFISRPQLARGNRAYQSLFINGRWVKSPVVDRAMDEAYKDLIVPGTFPVSVLHLTMEPSRLDVNVHPTKMEVRFEDAVRIRNFVFLAVDRTLSGTSLLHRSGEFFKESSDAKTENAASPAAPTAVNPTGGSTEEVFKKPAETAVIPSVKPAEQTAKQPAEAPTEKPLEASVQNPTDKPLEAPAVASAAAPTLPETKPVIREERGPVFIYKPADQVSVYQEKPGEAEENAQTEAEKAGELREEIAPYKTKEALADKLRLIGQVFKTYWLAEGEGLFYMMDQHAAHERVLYDRFREVLKNGNADSQILLQPDVYTVNPKEIAELPAYQPVLEKLGFGIEAFGEDAVIVREVPYIFNGPLPSEFVAEMLDMLHSGSRDAARDALIDKIAMMSCKAAVKGNTEMSFAEAEHLLKELFNSENPYNCPHGRPTVITFSEYEIEKKFKRIM